MMIQIQSPTLAPPAQRRKTFASAVSAATTWRAAAYGLASQINESLGGQTCHLALLFVSGVHPDLDPEELHALVSGLVGCRTLIACSAWGVIGTRREIETEPAMAMLAMHLPGVEVLPFSLSSQQGASMRKAADLYGMLDVYPSDKPNFLLLADPQQINPEKTLRLFNAAYPGRPVMGGLASASVLSRENWLTLAGRSVGGAVGVALSGAVEFRTLVSQGSRPIGRRLVVTKASGRTLYELDGRPALDALTDALSELPPMSRDLNHQALFLGLEAETGGTVFRRGLYLARTLLGFDMSKGTLRIGAGLKAGRRVRFHLADPAASERDLRSGLRRLQAGRAGPQAGLLISSCGKGRFLYGEPDHDVRLIGSALGTLPLSGFFAAGEIAPFDGTNYLHGMTSCLSLIG